MQSENVRPHPARFRSQARNSAPITTLETGGGGGHDGGMEARIVALEKGLEYVIKASDESRADFKAALIRLESKMDQGFDRIEVRTNTQFLWLLTFFVSGVAGLFAMIARGFKWY